MTPVLLYKTAVSDARLVDAFCAGRTSKPSIRMAVSGMRVTDPLEAMRVRVLLSLQRGMLGMVTGPLKGVAVSWENRSIRARFFYDGDSEGASDLVAEIETEVMADFPADVTTAFVLERVTSSKDMELTDGEVWVFLRA